MRSATSLPRAEKESVRSVRVRVVLEVRVAHTREVREARERGDGEPSMNEPVVHDEVRDAEHGHSDADAKNNLAKHADLRTASVEDRHDRDRRVQHGERVVRLEATAPSAVMRTMHAPEDRVPCTPVEQRRPQLHRHRHDDCRRSPYRNGDHRP